MSNDIKTRLAKEIFDFKWPVPTTDVMRGWNLALDSLVEYKLTNDIEKVVRCYQCKLNPMRSFTGCPMAGIGKRQPIDYCSYGEKKDG